MKCYTEENVDWYLFMSEMDRDAEIDWLEQDYQLRMSTRPTLDGDDEVGFLSDADLDALWSDIQEGL